MGRLVAALAALAASLLRDDANATSSTAETDAYAMSSHVVTADAAVTSTKKLTCCCAPATACAPDSPLHFQIVVPMRKVHQGGTSSGWVNYPTHHPEAGRWRPNQRTWDEYNCCKMAKGGFFGLMNSGCPLSYPNPESWILKGSGQRQGVCTPEMRGRKVGEPPAGQQVATPFSVTVPPGVPPGQPVQFTAPDGRVLQAVVPAGLREGDTFSVSVPPAAPPPPPPP